MAGPMRDNPERGSARKALHDRLEREEMGDEAYRKWRAPDDMTTKVALGLVFVAVAVIILTLG